MLEALVESRRVVPAGSVKPSSPQASASITEPTVSGAEHVVLSVATADVLVMPRNGSFEAPTVLVLPPTDEWRVTDSKLSPNDIRPAAANDPSSTPR
jgi:hypothetical protein